MAWGLWLSAAAVLHCRRGWKPLGGEGCSGEQGEMAAAGSAAPCAPPAAGVCLPTGSGSQRPPVPVLGCGGNAGHRPGAPVLHCTSALLPLAAPARSLGAELPGPWVLSVGTSGALTLQATL